MDRDTLQRFRGIFEQAVLDFADERGYGYFKRYVPFKQPGPMPMNIVTQHKAGAFAGLLAQPIDTQEQAIRRRAQELLEELVGGRDKRVFLLEERPLEFWQEGNHLHYCWRVGCAEQGEEQTEEQWMHAAASDKEQARL